LFPTESERRISPKTGRCQFYKIRCSIQAAVVFHITAGLFKELFRTHPDSKVIQTGLMLVLAVIVVVKERPFFLKRKLSEPWPAGRGRADPLPGTGP